MRELGWADRPVNVSGFVEPFDTWADMSHLAPERAGRSRRGPIAYFCNALPDLEAMPGRRAARVDRDESASVFAETPIAFPRPRYRPPLAERAAARKATSTGSCWPIPARERERRALTGRAPVRHAVLDRRTSTRPTATPCRCRVASSIASRRSIAPTTI